MLILSLLLFIIPALFGIVVFSSLNILREKISVLVTGTLTGLAFVITLFYALSILTPLTPFLIGTVLIVLVALTAVLLTQTRAWPNWKNLAFDRLALGILLSTTVLFIIIAPKLIIQKPDGLYTGIINAYGDVAWHAAVITTLADHPQFPPQDPIFSGTRLIYPFLTDFFSAILLNSGASLVFSINSIGLVLIPVLLTVLYCFARDITHSRMAGLITTVLFLFGGATLGFTRFASNWNESGNTLWQFLLHLPDRDYSGVGTDEQGFHFLNPVFSLLLPQRSFLFGIPMAISIVHLLFLGSEHVEKRKQAYLMAGIISGILPLFHAHTVLSVAAAVIALFCVYPNKKWIWFVLIAGVVGLPEVLFFITDLSGNGNFFRYAPGWLAENRNWILYWLQNTGFIFPLIILGFFLPIPKILKALSVSALIIFATANIWLFAPWAWDNFKLIIFWFIFSLPMVSYVLSYPFSLHREKDRMRVDSSANPLTPTLSPFGARGKIILVPLVILLILFQSTSAILDIWKVALPTAAEWLEWSSEGLAAAEMIKANTQPNDVLVTASIHNSPVVLSGRPLYLGYAAHVWSHGRIPWNREKAVESFYEGDVTPLPETAAQYILVGPDEIYKYPSLIIQPQWQFVAESGEYRLYKL